MHVHVLGSGLALSLQGALKHSCDGTAGRTQSCLLSARVSSHENQKEGLLDACNALQSVVVCCADPWSTF